MSAPTITDSAFLAAAVNAPDALAPTILEGNCLDVLACLPANSIHLIATSPPYPRAQRKPEDLGRYRRFVDEDGSVTRMASKGRYRSDEFQDENCRRKREQYASEPVGAQRFPHGSARRAANLAATIGAPHARKKADREGLGHIHGRPNLKGETGLALQIHPDEWWNWFRPIAEQMLRVLAPRRALLLNLGGVVCPTWNHHTYDWDLPSQMRSIGAQFIRPIYWVKPNGAPTTAENTMTNCVEHVYWFSKGVDDDHAPIWFPWELHYTKNGNRTKRPMVGNVWEIPVGTTRWPAQCPRCEAYSPSPGGGQVWRCRHCGEDSPKGEWQGTAHFAAFPLELAENMVRGFSYGARPAGGMLDGEIEAELVLDPFCGSGTTLIAARKLGRRSIGMELNPEGEIDCARARWAMEFGG